MDSIATPKSKKKNKLFPCFRAAASGSGHVKVRSKDDSEDVFPFITVDENVRPLCGCDGDSGHRKKKGSAGALSRAFKAVLFGTSLAKKIRKRKAKEKENSKNEINQMHQALSSIGNRSGTASDNLNLYHNSSTRSSRTSAPFSSSSFCSSSPASSEMSEISFRFYPNGSNRLLRQINLRKILSGWFVLLVCLLNLILWGKLGAIMCTSVWILCLYRRRMGLKKGSAVAMSSGEYYKRRIGMEGFLKRERSSSAQNSILRID
ncbi:uncharacterized protein E5676_scaffold110G001060 [Cucumis melo var. makuwa]|uniref:Transmembrane protein n=1 Tax=Cucumis melo var. makuwa TaxID=1194695 RepID=A0A5A7SZR0_CUCMM|nr:uncharacterized protein E6C27_scaffold20G00330 [Cucumis melo var. makuwa]TYJ95821.1 uncharacterized protein E5676_scaffold110G001060 [Cucumis melo var. makuwa]